MLMNAYALCVRQQNMQSMLMNAYALCVRQQNMQSMLMNAYALCVRQQNIQSMLMNVYALCVRARLHGNVGRHAALLRQGTGAKPPINQLSNVQLTLPKRQQER